MRTNRQGTHVLSVPSAHAERAAAELADYDEENRDFPPREVLPPAAPGYVEGTILVVGLVILVTCFQIGDAFDLSWTRMGAAHAEAIRGGEPWRIVTALFLHADVLHLLSNLLFLALFGFLVAYNVGGGLGPLAILLAGALGNLTNALIQDPAHVSVGASTAVFGAVGVLCGSEWRRRNLLRQRRIRRAAPVMMALCILAFYGVPHEPDPLRTTDVAAHVTGLVCGLGIGTLLPPLMAHGGMRAGHQRAYGAAALGLCALSWALALLT